MPLDPEGGGYVEMYQHNTDKYGEPTLEQVPCPKDRDEAKASPYWLSWKAAMTPPETEGGSQKLLGTK